MKVAGFAFGPAGESAPLEVAVEPETVFGPNGPKANGL